MKKKSSRFKNKRVNPPLLFTVDYSGFIQYDNICINKYGFSYIDLIKKEQKKFKNILKYKYNKVKPDKRLRFLVNIHADFGHRKITDYKLCISGSNDYYKFIATDNYSDIFSFNDAITFFNVL